MDKASKSTFAGLFVCLLFALCLKLPGGSVAAQEAAHFGPEMLIRTAANKDNFALPFSLQDPERPYSLLLTNGGQDGSRRVRKCWVTLNGQTIVTPNQFNRGVGRLTVAIRPSQQNELRIKLKGGEAGSFISVLVEPTIASILNNPADPEVDGNLAGIGTPFNVAVDQRTHRAFISDRHWDSIIEADVEAAEVTRWFRDIDGDQIAGNGGTAGLCFNDLERTLIAVNGGGRPDSSGSISIVDSASGTRVLPLTYGGEGIQSLFVAVSSRNNIAAFDGRYNNGRRAYFIDLVTGVISARDEPLDLSAPIFSPATNQFVYAADGEGSSPSLFVYNGTAPFQRIKRINSSAPAGTEFDKLAVNTVTGVVVAVNQKDSSVYAFDLAAGAQIGRISIRTGPVQYPAADVAINSQSNTAVVVCRFIPLVTLIDLVNGVVAAEIPLPSGALPVGVAVDQSLNRVVIAENGLSSNKRNGSILILELPPTR